MGYLEQLKAAREDKTVRNLVPEFRPWTKKGNQVVGRFISSAPITSRNKEGTYEQYVFDTDDGPVKFALGSASDREIRPSLKAGGVYAITFHGKEDIGGNRSVNKFEVLVVAEPAGDQVGGNGDIPF